MTQVLIQRFVNDTVSPMVRLLALHLLLGAALLSPSAVTANNPEGSIVHITTFSQRPQWDEPWKFDYIRRSTGTGFVIEGRQIMTNAHVVSWSKEILVQRYRDSQPYVATVKHIAHDCDLAILEVDDPAFYEGMEPLQFGELPKVWSVVTTIGYPAGGDEISYTQGVVSRIESRLYAHNRNRSFLTGQTDAAINPGNSGGPVLQDGRVVGVAFQNASSLENIGYFIPTPIIEHFLTDVSDGRYDSFPEAGFTVSSLINETLRRYLRVDAPLYKGKGVRIDSILPGFEETAVVQVDDVLLSVNGRPVSSDGSVNYHENRVFVGVLFDEFQAGETLTLGLLRMGGEVEVELMMHGYTNDRAQGSQYDVLPGYFVYAGIVFTPLSADFLATIDQDLGARERPELYYELSVRRYEDPDNSRPEPVVIAGILPHPVNADLQIRDGSIVDKINGVRIEALKDVARAFGSNTERFDVIEFLGNQRFEVIERDAAANAETQILHDYDLPSAARL
jgi:S1-C subfamily serine protease